MKHSSLILFNFIFLSLLACQPKQSEVSGNSQNQSTSPEKTVSSDKFKVVDHAKIDNKKCQVIKKETYCDQVTIETDIFNNLATNNYIYQTITGSEEKLNSSSDLQKSLDEFSKKSLSRLSSHFDEEDGKLYPYAAIESDYFHLVKTVPQLAFFKHEYFEYTGGVHGMTQVSNLVIDTNTYQDLALDKITLAKPETQNKLLQLQKDAIFKELVKSNDDSGDDVSKKDIKKMMDEWDIELSTNWGFDENNLLFTYSPYEAAPYSYGIIDIAIPKDQLHDIIKPEYLDLIWNNSTKPQ